MKINSQIIFVDFYRIADFCIRRKDDWVKGFFTPALPAFEILAKTFKFGLCGEAQACLFETRCGELSLQAQNNSNVEILKNFKSLELFLAKVFLFQDKKRWGICQRESNIDSRLRGNDGAYIKPGKSH